MKIAVLGGGPAGLYFGHLWKMRHPDAHVTVFEQNAADATWGFGVVFSDRAWEFLRADDPQTADAIAPHMESWHDITLTHRGETITIDGIGFSAIGRLALLQLLQARARASGVEMKFDHTVTALSELDGYDLIVAADGLNSIVRRNFEGDFGMSLSYLNNKFIWFGTTKRFDTLSQTFIETEDGTFNVHHYRYAPDMSTFLIETDRDTWLRAGFHRLGPDATRAKLEQIYADVLDGHPLISNNSYWRNFPVLWNERWSFKNMVLVGDALHTAHFSIGSGTRLALEDCIALVKALEAEPNDLPGALARYEAERKPIVKKLVGAANQSMMWYENFADHMKLAPRDFAFGYITRSGRMDAARLRRQSPRFAGLYDQGHPIHAA